MRKIELPSEALAAELEKYLLQRRFAVHERKESTLLFADEMKNFQWDIVKGQVERWAKGKQLRSVESLRLESLVQEKEADEERSVPNESAVKAQAELKKKIDAMDPKAAEERYNYLQSKPIGELSDDEYEERLELAQRNFKKRS